MPDRTERRVAIACQGGGSHTAFTAGVLSRLLTADDLDDHRVVGLSGTSGGAVCALLAWSALQEGEPQKARKLLEGFWAGNSASTPVELAVNAWLVWASTLQSVGLLPSVSPYDLPVNGLDQFRELLRRWVDFERSEVDEDARHPLLLIGAVDVLSGRFRAFHSRRDRITRTWSSRRRRSPPCSRRCTPTARLLGRLFSNPPVRELLEAERTNCGDIQINPTARATEPRSVLDITDRRNELSGNLSLYQELHVIEKIDQLLADGLLTGEVQAGHGCASSSSTAPGLRSCSDPRRAQPRQPVHPRLMRQGEHTGRAVPDRAGLRAAVAPEEDVTRWWVSSPTDAELESIDPFRNTPACVGSSCGKSCRACAATSAWTSRASSSPGNRRPGRCGSTAPSRCDAAASTRSSTTASSSTCESAPPPDRTGRASCRGHADFSSARGEAVAAADARRSPRRRVSGPRG